MDKFRYRSSDVDESATLRWRAEWQGSEVVFYGSSLILFADHENLMAINTRA